QRVTSDLAKSFALPDAHGAVVGSVAAGGPAKAAGVRPGDVIVAYDGRPVRRSDELPRLVAEMPVGRDVTLTVARSGQTLTLPARVAKLAEPEERRAAAAGGKSTLGVAVQTVTSQLAQELGHVEERARLGVSPTPRHRGHLRGARAYSGPAASPDARTAQRGARALV